MNLSLRMDLMRQAIDAIKNALVAEAAHRKGRTFEQWSAAEASAVWAAARDFAQQHALRIPLLQEVVDVEVYACGHSDYASKWARYVAEKMFEASPARSDIADATASASRA